METKLCDIGFKTTNKKHSEYENFLLEMEEKQEVETTSEICCCERINKMKNVSENES